MVRERHRDHGAAPRDRWTPHPFPREAIRRALLEGGIAGIVSHDRQNVVWKLSLLADGDPRSQFGITGVDVSTFEEVVAIMAEHSGFDPDPNVRHGLSRVDPDKVIDRLELIGDRLALAAKRGESVLLATGHPHGLPILYAQTGRLLVDRGAKLLRPREGDSWRHEGRKRFIRYVNDVAMVGDRVTLHHTHSPVPMQRMLEDVTPDLVFADHGFAGAAIEAGIDTVSIADVNDPALVVAHHLGKAGPVVVMDDNVDPDAYWACFQVIAGRFSGSAA